MSEASAPARPWLKPAGRRSVLLLTSHPIEGRDGADKEIAVSIAAGQPDVAFTWFGRLGGPRGGDLEQLPGRRLPVLSARGRPEAPEQVQAVLHAFRLGRRVDLVHAVMTVGPRFPAFSRLLHRACRGTPALLTVPGVVDPAVLSRCRPPAVTVALSRHTADALREAGFPDVRVIGPSVSLDRWTLQPLPTDERPVVLFAGHHDAGGGAHEALAIAGAAARRGARFRLVLALRSRPKESPLDLAEALLREAKAHGLQDVEVLGRVDDMPALLARTSVLLFPPTTLAGKADVPLTVIEALATGRPVVATDLPHFAALGEAVLTVPVGDAEAGGEQLVQVLADLPGHDRRGHERRAAVGRAFSPELTARAYTALYDELLSTDR